MRARLTDQALVAVTLARAVAADRGGQATAGDLLVGLAAEPEGAAGRKLRERSSAAARLEDLAAAAAPVLCPLERALRAAADGAAPRPAGTRDLLTAALDVGAADLTDLLEAAGYEPEALRASLRGAEDPDAGDETLGLDPTGAACADLSRVAARVVAQVRAGGGGAVDLVLALAAAPDADAAAALPGDHEALSAALWRLRKRGSAGRRPGRVWDAGLDPVVGAARAWRAGGRVTTVDLLRAAALAGGAGPAALLEEAAGGGRGDAG